MSLEPERREHYQKRLNQLLQNATQHIRSYYSELSTVKGPKLVEQTQNLWELSQRYRLMSSTNSTSGFALLSACQDIFEVIYEIISQLREDLAELAKDVEGFYLESQFLEEEQKDVCSSVVDWNIWLEKILTVLQTQAKYLEFNTHSMLPKLIQTSIVEQFKKDLQLPENYVASIYLGLAKAELKPMILC